jgi:NADH:ubiquinone oxidoreductase subunit 5 (subunit L)/multisubunit Na+/H+ antiporter MnhA subunit
MHISVLTMSRGLMWPSDSLLQSPDAIYEHVFGVRLSLGYLIDPLTSIMLILITTVGILVLIYSDGYMSHDEGY